MLDYGAFDVLTFDCYGTLIDWETGLAERLDDLVGGEREDMLARYARHEAEAEAGPYLTYREVVAAGLRGVAAELGAEPSEERVAAFAGSVGDWPPFPDSAGALARLKERFKLGVITNCDDDLFARSNQRLGVEFDWVITAQQVRAYKPSERGFEVAFERIGLPRERILHVAQSLFHDHRTAKRLGLSTVWIDRRHGRAGSGATLPAEATPDATFPDMASFTAVATA
ncbi:MAG TPA: haloacid dehalogenase type II [Solirubrobacteraceae bacterium]|nr:haloacid dehalogenase type II [Solirubrobacteraceae bacterium]